jgi:hypothetical protein
MIDLVHLKVQYGHLNSDSLVLEIKKTLDAGELTSITSNQEMML